MSYLEKLLRAGANPAAPPDETRDVNSQLFREFFSGLSTRDLQGAEYDPEEIRDQLASVAMQGDSLRKAVVLNSTYYAMAYPKGQERGAGHKSILYVNHLGVMGAANSERWAEKPTMQGGFEFLRYMVDTVDVLSAIIMTRQRQVAAFCQPYREDDNNPLGYRFVRRDGERFTEDDEKEVQRLENILQNSGTEFDPTVRRWVHRRRTFQGFTEALVADSLTADACPIEVEPTLGRGVAGWYNIPMETVRLAYEDGYEGDDSIVGVQLSPEGNLPVVGYERPELIYEVRNPRSSLAMSDYGRSENEVIIRAMTSYLNTFTFNATSLDRNSIPRGFLTLYGRFGKRALNDFRARWNAMMRGAAHRWNLPVLVSPAKNEGGAVYTPVDTANEEMFKQQWLIFLVSLACAAHGIAPEEINIKSFSPNQSGLAGKDTAEKLQSGRDKGLIPFMLWYANLLNDHLLLRFSKRYRLVWVGLYPEDEDRKAERQKLVLTVDEMRAIDGEEPHPDPEMGSAPVNPVHMSFYSQQKMLAQQQQMGGGDPSQAGGYDAGDEHPSGLPSSELPPPYLRDGQPSPDGRPAPPPLGARPQLPPPGGGAGVFAKANAPGARRLIVSIRDVPTRPRTHGGGHVRRTPSLDEYDRRG